MSAFGADVINEWSLRFNSIIFAPLSIRLLFDEQLFREALALYEGTHDFTEFCKAHSRGRVVERVGVSKFE